MSSVQTNNYECPICLDPMSPTQYKKVGENNDEKIALKLAGLNLEGRKITKLTKSPLKSLECGHIFDRECIKDWLEKNPTCPVCVRNVSKSKTHKSINYVLQQGVN